MNIIKAIANDIYLFALQLVSLLPGRSGEIIRSSIYRLLGAKVGRKTRLQVGMVAKGLKNISVAGETTIMDGGKIIANSSSVEIGSKCSFNTNVYINAGPGGSIKIGDNVLIGPNTVLRSSNHAFDRIDVPIISQGHIPGKIEVGNDVWIGANCVILPDVKIGSHSIVAAGAVVNKDVAEYEIVGGVPAKKIGARLQSSR